MSHELFEKYLLGTLTDEEKRRLSELLSREEAAREFVAYVQEWTLVADLAGQRKAARASTSRFRERDPRAHWGWLAAGVAAAVLVVAGLVVTRPPEPVRGKPVAHEAKAPPVDPAPRAPEPAPAPAPPPAAPAPDLTPRPRDPKPVPPPPEKIVIPAPPVPAPPPPRDPEPKPAPRETVPALALVEHVEGEVYLLGRDGKADAKVGASVLEDHGLVTIGPESYALVRYPDGTLVELSPDSRVERFSSGPGKRLYLVQGTMKANVTKQPPGQPLVVATPHAEATVLGTQLSVSPGAQSTRLDVTEGRVRLTRLPERDSVEVTAGHFAIAGKGLPLRPEVSVVTGVREFQDGVAPTPGYAGTRDTELSQVDPAQNLGASPLLEADGDETGGKSLCVLLKWDLSSIPPGSVIRSVSLTLYIDGTAKGLNYQLFEVRRAWAEADATWTRPWARPGAKGPGDRGSELLAEVGPRDKGPCMLTFNDAGLAAVQAWVRNPAANQGILIGNDLNGDGFKFESRESSVPSRRPKLTVTYSHVAGAK